MNARVETNELDLPPQTVVLELSPQEFAVIYLLAYSGNGGRPTGLRTAIERGLSVAYDSLAPGHRGRIDAARERHSCYYYPADRVEYVYDPATFVDDDD